MNLVRYIGLLIKLCIYVNTYGGIWKTAKRKDWDGYLHKFDPY